MRIFPLLPGVLSTVLSLAAWLAPGLALAAADPQLAGARLVPLAHVSPARARAAALRVRPGHVVNQELEKEAGGSGLRYSFDIRSAGKVYEVGIDARTGKLLENTVEGPHLD